MARASAISLLCVGLLGGFSWAEKNKAQARLGDLLVIAESVDLEARLPKSSEPGYHDVRFRVRFRNAGKNAICTSFKLTLESTYGVVTRGSVHFDDKDNTLGLQVGEYPDIHMLLPGNELESDVVFKGEKDGVGPETLVVTDRNNGQQDCGHHSFHMLYPARISVKNIPQVAAQPHSD